MITGDEALHLARKFIQDKVAEALYSVGRLLQTKVDKIEGKGLSSNDFTDALKDKLDGIETGAEVNTVTGVKGSSESSFRAGNVSITKANIGLGNVNNTSDANKPISTATQGALDEKVDKVAGKGLSTNDFSDTLKTKLDNVSLIEVVTPSFSSLPKTFYSSALKSNCKVVGDAIELSYPKAGSIDWNVTFANGSLTISGTFKGNTATTASMSIWLPTETITLTNS